MNVWKSALAARTFVSDVNYFADWYAADWSGGWTSEGIFPGQDFETDTEVPTEITAVHFVVN